MAKTGSNLDGIVDTILNGQVVEEASALFGKLQYPQDSHRLIQTVWEGLDYFYCIDTTGTEKLNISRSKKSLQNLNQL